MAFFYRYLEGCSTPDTVKEKSQPASNTAAYNSDPHSKKMNDNTIKRCTGICGLTF